LDALFLQWATLVRWATVVPEPLESNFPEPSRSVPAVGEMWQQASEAEKAPYIALSNADKERYHAELAAYKQRYGSFYFLYLRHGHIGPC
jgi:HMG (high mobility group) box